MSYLVCAFGRVLGFLCGLFSKLLIGDFEVNLYLVTAADLYAINQTGQNHEHRSNRMSSIILRFSIDFERSLPNFMTPM